MFATWKRHRDDTRRREAILTAALAACAAACVAEAARDHARAEFSLITGSLR